MCSFGGCGRVDGGNGSDCLRRRMLFGRPALESEGQVDAVLHGNRWFRLRKRRFSVEIRFFAKKTQFCDGVTSVSTREPTFSDRTRCFQSGTGTSRMGKAVFPKRKACFSEKKGSSRSKTRFLDGKVQVLPWRACFESEKPTVFVKTGSFSGKHGIGEQGRG